jgi:hypothetical protein
MKTGIKAGVLLYTGKLVNPVHFLLTENIKG